MIVDSSVWVDSINRRTSTGTQVLESSIAGGNHVFMLPCVLQEVLQGASSLAHLAAVERSLAKISVLLVPDPVETARQAAYLYARCRWMGLTPRSPNDCLIAASCIELAQPLLHSDRDFDAIARIEPKLKAIRV